MSTFSRTPIRATNDTGRRVAQLFRQYRGLQTMRAVDLEAVLAQDDLVVATSRSADPGYVACLVRTQGETGGGIMIAAHQDAGRQRFSLAHELGHYHIPKHKDAGDRLRCADADLRARDSDRNAMEWEANDFAAELLMPRTLFSQDIRKRDVSFRTVECLAGPEMYNVSRTAAAWRLVQLTREACALVVSSGGKVQWVVRSDAFRYSVPERHQTVAHGTVAAGVFRGEISSDEPERVDAHQWLDSTHGLEVDLYESTFVIPSLNQTLSLLWVPEMEADEDRW